jgi:methyl-accepting chemotaxis protein
MTIDELVTKLRYEMDAQSVKTLEEAENIPNRMAAAADKYNASGKKFSATTQDLAHATSTINRLWMSDLDRLWMELDSITQTATKTTAAEDATTGTEEQDAALKELDSTTQTATKTTAKANREWDVSNRLFGRAEKTVNALSAGVKSLGAVTVATSGIMAAWGINAAKSAQTVSNLSHSLGLSTKEIQTMGSVYEQLGGSMESFIKDADTFQNLFGKSLDLDEMIKLGEWLAGMSERDAFRFGRAMGLTDDSIRIWRNYNKELRTSVIETEKLHANSKEEIESLTRMNAAVEKLSNTVKDVSSAMQAAMGPQMTEGMDALTASIHQNRDAFKLAGEAVGNYLGSAMKLYAYLADPSRKLTWSGYVGTARNEYKEYENAKAANNQTLREATVKELTEDNKRKIQARVRVGRQLYSRFHSGFSPLTSEKIDDQARKKAEKDADMRELMRVTGEESPEFAKSIQREDAIEKMTEEIMREKLKKEKESNYRLSLARKSRVRGDLYVAARKEAEARYVDTPEKKPESDRRESMGVTGARYVDISDLTSRSMPVGDTYNQSSSRSISIGRADIHVSSPDPTTAGNDVFNAMEGLGDISNGTTNGYVKGMMR